MSNNHSMPLAVARPRFFYGYVIVTAALFMSIVMCGARASFGVFFAPVLNEFGWTQAAVRCGQKSKTPMASASNCVHGEETFIVYI